MAQPRGFAGMFGNAVAKLTDIRPISAEDVGMGETNRSGGGKANRISRRDRKNQTAKGSLRAVVKASEDIDMKGTVPTGRGKFDPYNRSGRRATFTRDVVQGAKEPKEVVITGYAPGTENGLLQFLQQKTKTPWKVLAVKFVEQSLHIMVENIVVAKRIQRLTGYAYETNQLSVYIVEDDPSLIEEGTGKSTVDTLRSFLSRRWDASTKYLNLEAIADDAVLQDAGIEIPGSEDSNKVGGALMKLAGEMFPDVITISFARNQISKLKPYSLIAKYIPNVQHISFQHNKITNVAQLGFLGASGKLPKLKELILSDNPFRDKLIEKDPTGATYVKDVIKVYPTLQILDGQHINSGKSKQDFPVPCLGGFIDNDVTGPLVDAFLEMYFGSFENDRNLCINLYAPEAILTVTTNLKLGPAKARSKQERLANKKKETYTWETLNRKVGTKSKNKDNIFCGQDNIREALARLPATRHNLDKKEMIIDAFMLNVIPGYPNAINLHIHGDFISGETSTKRTYSYDRILIIAPSLPGSISQACGAPFTILNDQLRVRDYSKLPDWPTATLPTPPSTETDLRQKLIDDVQRISGLKSEFAIQCLQENNWDVQQAIAAYQRLREAGTIPAEAFVHHRM
ncbi:hypothetical protein INT43_008871 [Umbelopsis isabellina]|uniref:mRNA export factor mex67 n=1 Tax=Mortierella isabellina TaxID=91625 RepID=A0A8H7PWV0_MORIS|nr:hypothetical protein INT43_008871 [Umbelopsis isabellina]